MIQQSNGWHAHRRTESAREALDQDALRRDYFWQSRATLAGRRSPPINTIDINELARAVRRGN